MFCSGCCYVLVVNPVADIVVVVEAATLTSTRFGGSILTEATQVQSVCPPGIVEALDVMACLHTSKTDPPGSFCSVLL